MKWCTIVIVNYKKWDETLDCIRSVFGSGWPYFKIVVVDNHSQNNSLEHLMKALRDRPVRKQAADYDTLPVLMELPVFAAIKDAASLPDLVLLPNDRNAGFAGGNNIVIKKLLPADVYIWLLNPDMTVEKNTLQELVRMAEHSPGAVIGAVHRSFEDPARVILYGGARVNFWSGNSGFIKKPGDIRKIGYVSGGSLFADAAVFRSVGLLPEDYFLYWEETDWCYKARKKGIPMLVCETAVCYDKRSTTIGNGFLADYFYTRNGLLFLKRFKKGFLPSALLMVLFRTAKKVALGQGARARGVLRGTFDFLTGRRYENK